MKLATLRAIIADDNILKAVDIRKALNFNGINNVSIFRNQEEVWEEIYRSKESGEIVGLIVTDMHYPLAAGADPDEEAGFKLIERLQKERIDIPVIICSTRNYNDPQVLGSVWYRPKGDNNLELDFREVLNRLA